MAGYTILLRVAESQRQAKRADQNRTPRRLILYKLTPQWTVQFSKATWSPTTGSIMDSKGTHYSNTSRNQQNAGNIFKLQQSCVNCIRILLICNGNLHKCEPSCITCKANRREKGSTKKWRETRKISDEEIETKKVYKLENAVRCWKV